MNRIAHLVLVVSVLLVAPGCSFFGERSPADGTAPRLSADATRDPARQGPALPVPGATEGGTVTVLVPGDAGPNTLDPAAGWSVVGNSILQSLTHRSLTQYVRGEKGQAVLVPDLATDLGRPDATFTQWRFTVREGATWEDGSPVTPEQVAFGITRSFDDVHFPRGPGTQYTREFFAGAKAYRGPYVHPDVDFEGVRVEGRDVVIDMARPFPDMDHWGAFMAMGPAPTDSAAEPPAYGRRPQATGPYKVESFTPGSGLTLVRNPAWEAGSDPGRHQYVDRWVFEFDRDQAESDAVILSGDESSGTTIVHRLSAGRLADADRILGEGLVHQQQPCVSVLAPDNTRITDVRVRRAIGHSFDHAAVWRAAGDVPGVTRTPANSLLVPGTPGRTDHQPGGHEITFDPARARKLLAEAGHAPGEYRLTLAHSSDDPVEAKVNRAVVRGLEKGGFAVTSVQVEGSVHDVYGRRDHRVNRRLNLRHLNWCADWPGASTLLPTLLGSGQPHNLARFSRKGVDREIRRIQTLPLDAQPAAWGALSDRVVDQHFPVVPTGYTSVLVGFGTRIGNPSGEAATGAVNYKDLFVVR